MKKCILPFLLAIGLFISCKKESDNKSGDTIVYIAGYQWDSLNGNDRATVWKNGSSVTQQLGLVYDYYANAIAVNGGDIYTTGFENQPGQWKCQVWKNGQHQYSLGSGYSVGNGIGFSNNNLFITGMLFQATPRTYTAIVWKNQQALDSLAVNGTAAAGNAIAFSGNDVYVAGYENGMGKLWKNGIEQTLNGSGGFTLSAVKISGTDVYVTGYTGNQIRYWKNGNPVDLVPTPGTSGFISGIDVEGTDVYISGWEWNGSLNQANYWKNGNKILLGNGTQSSKAHGIAVKKGKVYVAGDQNINNNLTEYACLWVNGNISIIGQRISNARAITVQ